MPGARQALVDLRLMRHQIDMSARKAWDRGDTQIERTLAIWSMDIQQRELTLALAGGLTQTHD